MFLDNVLLLLLLLISSAVLIVTMVGLLVRRNWRKSTSWTGCNDEDERFAKEMETLPISDTFQPDLRTVLGGKKMVLFLNIS